MSVLTRLPEEFYDEDAFEGFSADGAFRLADARAMMWLSQLAYEDDPGKIDKIGRKWGFARTEGVPGAVSRQLPIEGTMAIVAESPTAVAVAFAGTDPLDLPDWITNFTLDPIPGRTYRGFQNAIDEIWDDRLKPRIDAALASHPGARLFFTGHSLGGGLAVLAAEKTRADRAPAAVYTFGMPRAGTEDFRRGYEGLARRTYRLHLDQDIVPSVPTLAMEYRHVGLYLHCPEGRFGGAPEAVAEELPESLEAIRTSLREIEEHVPFLRAIKDRLSSLTGRLAGLGGLPLPAGVQDILDRLPAPRVPNLPRRILRMLGIGRTPLPSPFLTPHQSGPISSAPFSSSFRRPSATTCPTGISAPCDGLPSARPAMNAHAKKPAAIAAGFMIPAPGL